MRILSKEFDVPTAHHTFELAVYIIFELNELVRRWIEMVKIPFDLFVTILLVNV